MVPLGIILHTSVIPFTILPKFSLPTYLEHKDQLYVEVYSFRVFFEHASFPGHECGLLVSPVYKAACQNFYSPKNVLPSFSCQAIRVSVICPSGYVLPQVTVASFSAFEGGSAWPLLHSETALI